MNDLLDAISARIKAPYFGYALLAFVSLNWRGLFLLAVTKAAPQDRLAAFDAHTSFWSLLFFPLFVGFVVTAMSPWIKLLFGFIARRPMGYMDDLQLIAEHRKTIRRTELEQSRSALFASKESELIDRAKRDEEVLEIENEELKEKLKKEIDALRRERDQMSVDIDSHASKVNLTSVEKDIISGASSGDGRIIRSDYLDGRVIRAGLITFGGDNREFSKYDFALKSLVSKGLVTEVGSGGGSFELTHTGWLAAGMA